MKASTPSCFLNVPEVNHAEGGLHHPEGFQLICVHTSPRGMINIFPELKYCTSYVRSWQQKTKMLHFLLFLMVCVHTSINVKESAFQIFLYKYVI